MHDHIVYRTGHTINALPSLSIIAKLHAWLILPSLLTSPMPVASDLSPPTRFLFLGDSTMRRTVMQFASMRGCSERERAPGCGFHEYFGLKRDDSQRWPPGACEGPAEKGKWNRGE